MTRPGTSITPLSPITTPPYLLSSILLSSYPSGIFSPGYHSGYHPTKRTQTIKVVVGRFVCQKKKRKQETKCFFALLWFNFFFFFLFLFLLSCTCTFFCFCDTFLRWCCECFWIRRCCISAFGVCFNRVFNFITIIILASMICTVGSRVETESNVY